MLKLLKILTFYWKELPEQLKMKKEQKGQVLEMLLGPFGARFLGNLLTEKGKLRGCYGNKRKKRNFKSWLKK